MSKKKDGAPKKTNKKKNLEICPDKKTAIKENKKLDKLRQTKEHTIEATTEAWGKGIEQAKEHLEEVITSLHEGNTTVELLNPKLAWSEIKCYEMTEEFVLQPIYNPVRIKDYIKSKTGRLEAKLSEEMKIILLCVDRENNRELIYPYSGSFSKSTFIVNGSKYQVPSEPDNIKSLPNNEILQRFLNGEKINGKQVWKDFKKYREKYLDVGKDKRKIISQTAWDLGSHFFMVFNAYPYHDFYGFRGSGKNRSHEISKELCFHAIMIATTRSISSIFRGIDAMGCTWLKNEAETLRGKNKNEDLLELCLEGYKQGSSIPLTSDQGKDKSRFSIYFDVYSPKSFTSDKNIYGAFGTRMVKYLQEKTSGIQGKIDLDKEKGRQIRDNAYLLRLQDGKKIAKLAKTPIDDLLKDYNLDLVSRDREIFFPLLIITREYASKEEFEDLISFIKDYLEKLKQETLDQPISVVLRSLYATCYEEYKKNEDKKEFWINTKDVRKKIIFNDPEAWRIVERKEYEEKEIIKTSETAKFYTDRKVGSILTDLGFDEKRQCKGLYQRKVDIKTIERKAKVLNIQIDDAIDKGVLDSW